MLLIKLLHWLLGYVRFSLSGEFPERFMNMTASEEISVWDMHKQGGILKGCVRADQYAALRSPARRAKGRLHIDKKVGLPFVLRRYKGRPGLFVGVIAAALIPVVMSQFVWRIEVNGNVEVPDAVIIQELSSVGLRRGTVGKNADCKQLAEMLILSDDRLSWASIYIDGSVAQVEVREKVDAPDVADDVSLCNVVAAEDGRIVNIEAYRGTAVVKVGEAVTRGSLLVSGTVTNRVGGTELCHASAKVTAEVCHTLTLNVPKTVDMPADESYDRYALRLFSLDIPLYFGELEGNFAVETTPRQLSFFGAKLPVYLITERHTVLENVPFPLQDDDAEALCTAAAKLWALENYGDRQAVSFTHTLSPDGRYTAEYTCLEDIGKEEPFSAESEDTPAATEGGSGS